MPWEPFPERSPDDPDPGSPGWRRVDDSEPVSSGQPAGQGLFVCLPAEELSLEGFGQDGRADTMAPGPLLATIVEAVTGQDGSGLAALADDQLMGVLSGIRRIEARAVWGQLAVLAEVARRRPGGRPGDGGRFGFSDFAPDEVAAELRLSVQSAAGQMVYAVAVAGRLPASFAALAAGQIHPLHLRIIDDETRILSPEQAAAADEILAEAARSQTFGELRYAARRLVLKLDPDAARRRKETAAKREAQVRRFREDSGNAGMIARELPCDEVLAAWQHVDQRARDLRAAGVPGSLRELRIQAYLDLLQERDSRDAPTSPAPDRTDRPAGPGDEDSPDGNGGTAGPLDADGGPGPGGPGGPGPGGNGGPGPGGNGGPGPGGNGGPGPGPRGGPAGPARRAGQDQGPAVAALINITVPLDTLLGQSATPGEAAGFGPLDPDDARALVAAAARHPDTRWCVTALYPDGTTAAHGCARGRHPPPPGPGPASPTGTTGDPPDPDPPPGPAARPRHLPPPLRSLEVRDGPGGVGIRRPARLPVAVRTRVRIPAQVTAKAQLQAARGDPVALDDGLRAAVLVSQRAPRRLQQVRGLRLLRGRVPLAVQQLKAGQAAVPPGQRLPGQVAGTDPGPHRQLLECWRAQGPTRSAGEVHVRAQAQPRVSAQSYGHLPGTGGRVGGQ